MLRKRQLKDLMALFRNIVSRDLFWYSCVYIKTRAIYPRLENKVILSEHNSCAVGLASL